MLKRFALALVLTGFASAAFAQSPSDLSFHRTVAGPIEVIQRTVVLTVPAPPPPGSSQGASLVTAPLAAQLSLADQLAVEAAIDWMVGHGYLTDVNTPLFDVTISGNSITITTSGPGGVVIVLGNGPFLPTEIPHRVMAVTVFRPIQQISNGF